MDITRTPKTQHIGIDMRALHAFLLKRTFAPAFLNEINIIIVPVTSSDDVDDEMDEALALILDIWLYAKNQTAEQMNRQLLTGLRRACYENDQNPATEACLANWGIDALRITDKEIEADIAAFADWYAQEVQFVTVSSTAQYPAFETDQPPVQKT